MATAQASLSAVDALRATEAIMAGYGPMMRILVMQAFSQPLTRAGFNGDALVADAEAHKGDYAAAIVNDTDRAISANVLARQLLCFW